jgi:hypothetical protein
MANNLDSNVTRKVARVFLEKFEASRVVTKTVNTQLLEGKFNPSSGSNVDFKRPHDYNTIRTAGGDISLSTKSDIIAGKATGTVQNYFTVATEWGNVEEALELDQLDQILAPMATRIVTDLEVDFAKYMFRNCNLSYGAPGTVVDAWSDVAGAGALMNSIGVPMDDCYYVMNPFTQQNLASVQQGLNSGSNSLVDTAFQRAQISSNFGGLKAMASNALGSYTSGSASDRAGTLAANPTVTYVAAKDTMTQTLSCAGFSGNATFKAGEIIQVTGRFRCSLSTRQPVYDSTGAQILWRAVITADATSNTAGAVTLTVAGPAIFESAGQYNTTTAALASGDVITVLGAASTNYQPNLFYHRQAYGMGSVKLPKLYSTDTVATTEDGFSIRVSKYADGDANTQKIRFDLLPAYATFNPFFAGQGFGIA